MKRPLYPCAHLLKIFPPSLHFSATPFLPKFLIHLDLLSMNSSLGLHLLLPLCWITCFPSNPLSQISIFCGFIKNSHKLKQNRPLSQEQSPQHSRQDNWYKYGKSSWWKVWEKIENKTIGDECKTFFFCFRFNFFFRKKTTQQEQ